MYKPEFVLENLMYKHLWEFEIQTDHPVPTRRPDLVIVNKKKENLQSLLSRENTE